MSTEGRLKDVETVDYIKCFKQDNMCRKCLIEVTCVKMWHFLLRLFEHNTLKSTCPYGPHKKHKDNLASSDFISSVVGRGHNL